MLASLDRSDWQLKGGGGKLLIGSERQASCRPVKAKVLSYRKTFYLEAGKACLRPRITFSL